MAWASLTPQTKVSVWVTENSKDPGRWVLKDPGTPQARVRVGGGSISCQRVRIGTWGISSC